MLNLEYHEKGSTSKAFELARKSESFSITLRGRARERVLKGTESYKRFNESFVLQNKKNVSVLATFLRKALLAVPFWGLCLYRDRERRNLEFQDHGDHLVVRFDFNRMRQPGTDHR